MDDRALPTIERLSVGSSVYVDRGDGCLHADVVRGHGSADVVVLDAAGAVPEREVVPEVAGAWPDDALLADLRSAGAAFHSDGQSRTALRIINRFAAPRRHQLALELLQNAEDACASEVEFTVE